MAECIDDLAGLTRDGQLARIQAVAWEEDDREITLAEAATVLDFGAAWDAMAYVGKRRAASIRHEARELQQARHVATLDGECREEGLA